MSAAPARQPAASAWFVLKALATTYLVVDLLSTLSHPGGMRLEGYAVYCLVVATAALLCWAPRHGALMLAPALAGCALAATQGSEVILLVLAAIVLVPLLDRRRLALLVAGLVVAAVVIPWATQRSGWRTDAGADLMFLAVALAVGLAARGFQAQHRAGQARIQQLELEATEIRAEERTSLARELHDVVAHQLSIISLQVMGHRDADDPDELRDALDRVDDAARTAIAELQVLVRVLRDTADDSGPGQLERLAQVASPSDVADRLAAVLHDHGFRVELQLPAGVDQLERSLQSTVGRLLQESVTNVLRHADPAAPVRLAVAIDPSDVHVEVSSGLAADGWVEPLPGHSGGHGLRGLRERVSLVGGRLRTGPDGDRWEVRAVIPRDASRRLDRAGAPPRSEGPAFPVIPRDEGSRPGH